MTKLLLCFLGVITFHLISGSIITSPVSEDITTFKLRFGNNNLYPLEGTVVTPNPPDACQMDADDSLRGKIVLIGPGTRTCVAFLKNTQIIVTLNKR